MLLRCCMLRLAHQWGTLACPVTICAPARHPLLRQMHERLKRLAAGVLRLRVQHDQVLVVWAMLHLEDCGSRSLVGWQVPQQQAPAQRPQLRGYPAPAELPKRIQIDHLL